MTSRYSGFYAFVSDEPKLFCFNAWISVMVCDQRIVYWIEGAYSQSLFFLFS